MKHTTRLFPTLRRGSVQASILIAVFILSACAPAASSPTPEPASVPLQATATSEVAISLPTPTQPIVQPEATLVPTDTPIPVATSRGPDLEATDPTSVSLAMGGLHLVEFFRFT